MQLPIPTELLTELETLPQQFLSEDELVRWLADRIGELLVHRTEYLFNVFYCMDVSEQKMYDAMLPTAPEPADIGLAKLMIERQKERLRTKALYKQPPIEGEDW